MNLPLPTSNAKTTLNIGSVRSQIDDIDRELAALIARRCALSANIAAAKRASGNAAFGWRPAREVEIIRRVLREQPDLNPELASSIWRALISANLTAQGDFQLIAIKEMAADAIAAFSVGTTPQIVAHPVDVLKALTQNDHAIGVLPWPTTNHWWIEMMEPRFASLNVCAASPIAGDDPQILLIAARAPEAAGDDISLIAGPIGALEGGVIAQTDGLALVACGEFIEPDTPLPAGCRLIGCFARA